MSSPFHPISISLHSLSISSSSYCPSTSTKIRSNTVYSANKEKGSTDESYVHTGTAWVALGTPALWANRRTAPTLGLNGTASEPGRTTTQSSQSHWKRGDVPCCQNLFFARERHPTERSSCPASYLDGGTIVGLRIRAATAMRIGDLELTGSRTTVFVPPRVSCL